MAFSLAPLSFHDNLLVATRQNLQKCVLWRELATEIRHDSHQLCIRATQLRRRSRQLRAQKACLQSESVAQAPMHVSPE